MGPSGAGKSTLLEILSGFIPAGKIDGAIWMNGRAVGKRFRRVSAFVNQSDMFVPTMSALETLQFHARLRIGGRRSAADVEERMRMVLETMGLWRSRNTQVGGTLPGGINVRGLSGGEKRRLTIACSLIARPSILFLDEPTSGLDSFAALNIMDYVSKLARLGHTVIASVHQPRSAIWEMFHKVCVLSEGQLLYFGTPAQAAPWFGGLGYRHSPRRDGAVSDWLIDLVSVGFAKPPGWAARSMTTTADVGAAAGRWSARALPPAGDGADGTLLAAMERGAARDAEAEAAREAAGGGSPGKAAAAAVVAAKSAGEDRGNQNNRPTSAATSVPPPPPPTALEKLLPFLRRPDERFAKYPTTWLTQFGVLTQRAWVNQLRNPADATSRFVFAFFFSSLGSSSAFPHPSLQTLSLNKKTSRLMLAVWVSACAGLIAYGVKLEPSTAG